jgi:peptidoglycan hydrolase-like protein with peptidoglycan-binding domain
MLRSRILAGNARLKRAALGPPSIKRAPPDDDFDAVQRIRTALKELGYVMPNSFKMGRPNGKFGGETFRTVLEFQRCAFPNDPVQWDGRVGKNTLAQLDEALTGSAEAVELPAVTAVSSISTVTVPSSVFV